MAFENHWKPNGLHRTFSNTTSGQEVLGSNLSIQGDARFDSIKYVVNDFTRTQDFTVTQEDIDLIVSMDNVATLSKPTLKIAIVATLEPLLEWIRLYVDKMQGSPYLCEIFNDLEAAHKWVNEPI